MVLNKMSYARRFLVCTILLVFCLSSGTACGAKKHEVIPYEGPPITSLVKMLDYLSKIDHSEYGGHYGNLEKKNALYIAVLDNEKKWEIAGMAEAANNTMGEGTATLVDVKYSLAELEAAQELLFENREQSGIWSAGVAPQKNKVVVHAEEFTEEAKKAIYALVDEDMVELAPAHHPRRE